MKLILIPILLTLFSESYGCLRHNTPKMAEVWKDTLFGGFMDPKTGAIHKIQSTNSSSELQPSDVTTRIIGGINASPGEFPWQVSIQVMQGGSRFHICGGTILGKDKIATAAHCCADKTDASLVVVAGAHNMLINEPTQQFSALNRIVMHTEYNPNTLNNDVCKLILAEPFTYTNYVKKIKLCTSEPTSGSCPTSGWGTISATGNVIPTQLQKVVLSIVPRATCAWNYVRERQVTTQMICAGGTAGQQACHGDSGGPIVCGGCLAGVTSWGKKPCGQQYPISYPTVFANGVYFSNFFNSDW